MTSSTTSNMGATAATPTRTRASFNFYSCGCFSYKLVFYNINLNPPASSYVLLSTVTLPLLEIDSIIVTIREITIAIKIDCMKIAYLSSIKYERSLNEIHKGL